MKFLLLLILSFGSFSSYADMSCKVQTLRPYVQKFPLIESSKKIFIKNGEESLVDSLRVATNKDGTRHRHAYWLDAVAKCDSTSNCTLRGEVRNTYLYLLNDGTEIYEGYGDRTYQVKIDSKNLNQDILLNDDDQLSVVRISCQIKN